MQKYILIMSLLQDWRCPVCINTVIMSLLQDRGCPVCIHTVIMSLLQDWGVLCVYIQS